LTSPNLSAAVRHIHTTQCHVSIVRYTAPFHPQNCFILWNFIHHMVPDPPPQTASRSSRPFFHNTRSLARERPTDRPPTDAACTYFGLQGTDGTIMLGQHFRSVRSLQAEIRAGCISRPVVCLSVFLLLTNVYCGKTADLSDRLCLFGAFL